jgi:HEAT repeat protein
MTDAEIKNLVAKLGGSESAAAFKTLLEVEAARLTPIIDAFRSEKDAERRALILEVIWKHHDPAVRPVLIEALNDPHKSVWMQALNGLVAMASPESRSAVKSVMKAIKGKSKPETERREWFYEALSQIDEILKENEQQMFG